MSCSVDNLENSSRRPIKSRQSTWARKATEFLVARRISANSISWMSMVFATIGFISFYFAGTAIPWWFGMLLAVFSIQGRLVCNLLDGMVAEVNGKKSPLGKILNEVPDRYSDIVFLVGAGIATDQVWLGWMAACGAVLTAYVRSFCAEISGKQDFSGPMAKPQRMFYLSLGAIIGIFYPPALMVSLCLISLGSFFTSVMRLGTSYTK